jgi:hypothetical protein
MNNAESAASIFDLPLNEKEESNNSRTRLAYHVFLSRFFFDLKGLSETEKREIVLSTPYLREDAEDYYAVDSDADSIDSAVLLRHVDCIRHASNRWQLMSVEEKTGWIARASWLNGRPVPGKFECIPTNLSNSDVAEAMTADWRRFVLLLRNSITRTPRKLLSSMEYYFGNENVKIGSQSYRSFELNRLMRLCLFGRDESYLRVYEVIKKTKSTLLVHIASETRMKGLFTLSGLCGSEFNLNSRRHTCCGKVSTIRDGRHCIGYVLDESEDGDLLSVKLSTNEVIELPKPQFNEECGVYVYPSNDIGSSRTIEKYWPIRILIHETGRGKFTLNRVAYNNHNRIIDVHSS